MASRPAIMPMMATYLSMRFVLVMHAMPMRAGVHMAEMSAMHRKGGRGKN